MSGLLIATKTNAGRKMPTVASTPPGTAAQDVADEGGGGEQRAGRDLPDGDRVEQLRLGQPAEPLDEVGPQEGDQHVAGAVEHRADLEEGPEEAGERERDGGAQRRRQRRQAEASGSSAGKPPCRRRSCR